MELVTKEEEEYCKTVYKSLAKTYFGTSPKEIDNVIENKDYYVGEDADFKTVIYDERYVSMRIFTIFDF